MFGKSKEWFPRPNKNEVADWFSVPFTWLMNEDNLHIRKAKELFVCFIFFKKKKKNKLEQFPGWTSYEWNYIRPSDHKEFRIWGLSGAILLYLLVSAFKMTPKGTKNFFLFFTTLPHSQNRCGFVSVFEHEKCKYYKALNKNCFFFNYY